MLDVSIITCLNHGLTMRHLVLQGLVYLAVSSAQFTIPEDFRNYTDMVSFMTLKPKFGIPTTMRLLNCSPGEPEHFEYMMNKYERDFGSQISKFKT